MVFGRKPQRISQLWEQIMGMPRGTIVLAVRPWHHPQEDARFHLAFLLKNFVKGLHKFPPYAPHFPQLMLDYRCGGGEIHKVRGVWSRGRAGRVDVGMGRTARFRLPMHEPCAPSTASHALSA